MNTNDDHPESNDWLVPGQLALLTDESRPEASAGAPARPARRWRTLAGGLALLLAGVVGGAAAAQVWPPHNPSTSTGSQGTAPAPQPFAPFGGGNRAPGGQTGDGGTGSTAGGPANAASIANAVDDAVVDITTTIAYGGGRAAGTGMVVTSNGEVLTNNHVIAGASSIRVTDVGNGQTYGATVVGYDKARDIAVLQLQGASGLATIKPASGVVQTGDGVVGVGNAGGSGGTPEYAAGVVTDVGQTITATDSSGGDAERLNGLIETNADVVPGYSGGPLVNDQGQVVGMNTAASANAQFTQTGQGYAIPIADALRIAQRIESGDDAGTVHVGPTAMLGVTVQSDGQFGRAQGGATVAAVVRGGPAAAAGLSAGDVITAVDGHQVGSATALRRVMLHRTAGATVVVEYVDSSGTARSTTVRLASGPPQ